MSATYRCARCTRPIVAPSGLRGDVVCNACEALEDFEHGDSILEEYRLADGSTVVKLEALEGDHYVRAHADGTLEDVRVGGPFKVGDRVRVIDEVGLGTVIGISAEKVPTVAFDGGTTYNPDPRVVELVARGTVLNLDPIRPTERTSTDLLVNGRTVRVHTAYDADGGDFIELEGVDCDLEGEEPGLYYLAASGSIAARRGA